MEFAEIKNKTVKELNELLSEKRVELFENQLKVRAKQLKQFHKILDIKKIIARIMTLLGQKHSVK